MQPTTSIARFAMIFFPASHLRVIVYICLSPICDTQHPICDNDFFHSGRGKSGMTSKITVYFVEKGFDVD